MKWNFWKKEKKQLRELIIPNNKMLEILRLYDNYHSKTNEHRAESRFLLWTAIADIFPEVPEIKTGIWHIETDNVFSLKIVEGGEEE